MRGVPPKGYAMTKIDQFESVFRSAAKEVFKAEDVEIGKVLVVTDLDAYQSELLSGRVKKLLSVLGPSVTYEELPGEAFSTVQDLMGKVEEARPDLIATYRNLHGGGERCRFGLGIHLDALTQATTTPVLVLPDPDGKGEHDHAFEDTSTVMVVTDHLTGDNRLVSYGARLTEKGGTLYLAHIEDDQTFARYLAAISKVPEIDTETARREIERVLLKDPTDFVQSCKQKLVGRELVIEEVVRMGHRLHDYRELIEERKVDLLVFNTKDDTQDAMHGLAYPLAVQLRQIPLLML